MNLTMSRISDLLDARGASLRDLSRYTDIPISTLSTWRVRDYTPRDDQLERIALYLGTSVEYLKTGVEGHHAHVQIRALVDHIHSLPYELQILYCTHAEQLLQYTLSVSGEGDGVAVAPHR